MGFSDRFDRSRALPSKVCAEGNWCNRASAWQHARYRPEAAGRGWRKRTLNVLELTGTRRHCATS